MLPITEGYISWRDQRIAFETSGEGKPILFLHNGGADREVWRRQIEFFARSYSVLAFDFVGYGKSSRPDFPYTLQDQVSQLVAVLENRKIENPVLVGNCVGSATAIEFARLYPDRVDKLVLANVCGGPSFFPPLKLIARWPKVIALVTWFTSKVVYSPKLLWGDPPENSDPLYTYFKESIIKDPGFYLNRKNMTIGSLTFVKFGDRLPMPPGFPRNILFWGEKNKIMPRRYAETCLQYLKSEKFHSLPGAGHFCMHERAELVNREIEEFLGN
ncbi:MAG: alpha/beta hydrolase [Bdellovibrionota bacterium]